MASIDWDEYKEYKQYSIRNDNFETLLDFLKSYYNLLDPTEMFETLKEDEVAQMMLQKREILDAEALEIFLRKY